MFYYWRSCASAKSHLITSLIAAICTSYLGMVANPLKILGYVWCLRGQTARRSASWSKCFLHIFCKYQLCLFIAYVDMFEGTDITTEIFFHILLFMIIYLCLLQLLNQIVCEFPPDHPLSNVRPLRELLGHTPFQVCCFYMLILF